MKKFFTFISMTRYLFIAIFFGCFILFSCSGRSQRSAAFQDENSDRVTDAYDNHSRYMPQDAFFSVKDTGDIVHSIPTPGTYCQGLSWLGNYLWVVDNDGGPFETNVVYKLDPANGVASVHYHPGLIPYMHDRCMKICVRGLISIVSSN